MTRECTCAEDYPRIEMVPWSATVRMTARRSSWQPLAISSQISLIEPWGQRTLETLTITYYVNNYNKSNDNNNNNN